MAFDLVMGLTALFGYLLGSIPFGLLLTKVAGLGDIRAIGSGNIGATNVLRTGRKDLALLTLLLDSGKGAIAVLVTFLYIQPDYAALAGAAAFLGHCFPLYLNFKGGKGVATFFGTLLAIDPLVGGIGILTWLISAALFRISSLAALMAALVPPVYCAVVGAQDILPYIIVMTVLIFLRHRENIKRIIGGTEPKIGKK
ncbi:glycerol-3-phosphate 1-O-acyltransferase PlsY [Temperatibacter marinus]|uniref:Glycerol-3-phosphate acyltransferase n=1 Tax=Temperatibacter marinus TaxID=1456591 RepID=A0AA52EBT2_9PROT|nr:glycerol-3-phosphate 1-O-acyltransferase PlsY [Temperatibacter marinus]WND02462.1 glycerol-3-phosphate 1-O-acyltransferase PlsY [Temperatibacter marinus]